MGKSKAGNVLPTTNAGRQRETYHHGTLRQVLVDAADELLREQGIEGFSLREVARRVGVSPAAPAHHFKDAAGLLTEVAILGFNELSRYLDEWSAKSGSDTRACLQYLGQGYIRFALAYPARFHLMFMKEKLRESDELRIASEGAFSRLKRAICAELQIQEDQIDHKVMATVLLAWSTVHGFAHLALDGQFDRLVDPDGLEAFCSIYVPLILDKIRP